MRIGKATARRIAPVVVWAYYSPVLGLLERSACESKRALVEAGKWTLDCVPVRCRLVPIAPAKPPGRTKRGKGKR